MRDLLFAMAFVVTAVAVLSVGRGASADSGFDRVSDRDTFVQQIAGRSLTRLGIRLDVENDGAISGNAFGRNVNGSWTWEGGFFCRTIHYGRETLPRNCQMVKVRGTTVRFIADQGTGDTSDLRLR